MLEHEVPVAGGADLLVTAAMLEKAGLPDHGWLHRFVWDYNAFRVDLSAHRYYLTRVRYAPRLDRIWRAWQGKQRRAGKVAHSRHFGDWLVRRLPKVPIRPRAFEASVQYDNMLDEQVDVSMWTMASGKYALLGQAEYYLPRRLVAFEVLGSVSEVVYPTPELRIACKSPKGPHHGWYSRDGVSWHRGHPDYDGAENELQNLPVVRVDEDGDFEVFLRSERVDLSALTLPQAMGVTTARDRWAPGILGVTPEGCFRCPQCGSPMRVSEVP